MLTFADVSDINVINCFFFFDNLKLKSKTKQNKTKYFFFLDIYLRFLDNFEKKTFFKVTDKN